jgi:hypothetical protein
VRRTRFGLQVSNPIRAKGELAWPEEHNGRDEDEDRHTADHIYLPLDEDGNWHRLGKATGDTTKVARRTRLLVPPDIARSLQIADKARSSMTQRLLGFDPATGLAQWWIDDGEGNWAQKSSQDATSILDLNKEAANHCNPYNAERDVRMVARIPLIVIAKWRNELGVDYWNPDHQDKVDQLLNDPDWRWLRTDAGAV